MYSFVITLTFAADRASTETTSSLCYQSLIDFTLAITLIKSPCVVSVCWDQAWRDLKLTTLGKRIVNRLYCEVQIFPLFLVMTSLMTSLDVIGQFFEIFLFVFWQGLSSPITVQYSLG